MKLTKTSTYAIKTVILLAELAQESPVSCKTLAERGDMPYRYLLSILRTLATRGFLSSSRGAAGGFELSRDPACISLLDIIEAVEGPFSYDDSNCAEFAGPLRPRMLSALDVITRNVREELQSIKLSDVLTPESSAAAATEKLPPVTRIDTSAHTQNSAWTSPQFSGSSPVSG